MFGYTACDFRTASDWIDSAYPVEADRAATRHKFEPVSSSAGNLTATVNPLKTSPWARRRSRFGK